jgi:hypothetical protein
MGDIILLKERAARPAPDETERWDEQELQILRVVQKGLVELSGGLTDLKLVLTQLHRRMLDMSRR